MPADEKEHTTMEPLTPMSEDIQDELQRVRQDRRAFRHATERATPLRLFFAWLPAI
jgi:hypothetical protein